MNDYEIKVIQSKNRNNNHFTRSEYYAAIMVLCDKKGI